MNIKCETFEYYHLNQGIVISISGLLSLANVIVRSNCVCNHFAKLVLFNYD